MTGAVVVLTTGAGVGVGVGEGAAADLFVKLSVGKVVELAELVVDTADTAWTVEAADTTGTVEAADAVETLETGDPVAADAKASDLSAAAAARRFKLAATCSMLRFFFSLGGEPGFVLLDGLLFGGVGGLNSVFICWMGINGMFEQLFVGETGEGDLETGLLAILVSIGIGG